MLTYSVCNTELVVLTVVVLPVVLLVVLLVVLKPFSFLFFFLT